jgi:hypothetical protein
VMHVEQLAYVENGAIIECSDLWLRGDCFRLIAGVSRSGKGNLDLSMSMIAGAGLGSSTF